MTRGSGTHPRHSTWNVESLPALTPLSPSPASLRAAPAALATWSRHQTSWRLSEQLGLASVYHEGKGGHAEEDCNGVVWKLCTPSDSGWAAVSGVLDLDFVDAYDHRKLNAAHEGSGYPCHDEYSRREDPSANIEDRESVNGVHADQGNGQIYGHDRRSGVMSAHEETTICCLDGVARP